MMIIALGPGGLPVIMASGLLRERFWNGLKTHENDL